MMSEDSRAPGNVGNTRSQGNQNNGQGVNNQRKVICYNCREEGHVARQCKEPKRPKDSLWHQDKAMLLQAKEKGAVLDAEAEAFLADVECTVPLAEPLALSTTNMFQVSHEDAYDSDVDDEPNAAAAFMANLSSSSSQINEVRTFNDTIFETVSHSLSPKAIGLFLPLDIASQLVDPPKPVTPFVRTSPAKSQVQDQLWYLKAEFSQFDEIIKERTTPRINYLQGSYAFCYLKKCFDEAIIPFFITNVTKFSQHTSQNLCNEVTEFKRTFDELDTEYEHNLLEKNNLQIEKNNLMILNECLISDSIAKDICSIVLASVNFVPPISDCMCAELRSSCDREHNGVLELDAEILKKQQMINDLEHTIPCDQLQGRDETIRNLTKPATESRKPMPKSHTQNHRIFPSKSVNARRAADHNRKLNVVDHNQFMIRSLKSVNTKTPQAKHSVNHTKKAKADIGFQGQPVADSIADKIETTTTYGKFKRSCFSNHLINVLNSLTSVIEGEFASF
ncbi:integrase, catalytic region, zinc finger, CCHC-type containing protein [Tanacetum coccineum]